MLQPNSPPRAIGREPAEPEIVSGADTLRVFVGFFRRQFPLIALMTLLAIILAVIYLITARASFTAEAQMMIDARKLQVFQQQSVLGDVPIDSAQVESQIEILKSENVAAAVIKNRNLNKDPEFVGSGGGLLGALFNFILNAIGSEQDQAASEFELGRHAIRAFQDRLSVKRVGLSYVIQIGFRSYDPEQAAQIVNAVADAYIVDQLEAKYQATKRASVWLQDRIGELRDQVSAAERAVVDFKTKNNIVSTGGTDKPLLGQQEVTELSSQLVIARAHTAETKARLDRIDAVLSSDARNESFGATVTDTLKSEVVSKLRSQYLDLAARESDWSAKYGRDHVAVVNLRNQLREIRNAIFQELRRLAETYKSDYEISKQREEGVEKELAKSVSQSQQTDVKSVALRELQSTAQTYKTLYDNFLQRYMESVQQQSFPISEARLITPASRPLQKSSPKTLLVLAITSFGGIVLGLGIGLMRDLSDRVFRTSSQIESLLQTDCIGLVPLLTDDEGGQASGAGHSKASGSFGLASDLRGAIKSAKGKASALISSFTDNDRQGSGLSSPLASAWKDAAPRTIVRNGKAHWTVVNAPLSRFAEAIRSIKLAVDLNNAVKANRVIGFTSSLPNEGKSTVAVALAQLISQGGKRTIVVDCDLRNPSLSRALAPDANFGLLEVITGRTSLEEAIWTEPSLGLAFLPVVVRSRMANSSEILYSAPMKKLFDRLRDSYDYVIVDFPPLAPIVDVQGATHLVDSFVFVIEWGRTKIDIVEHVIAHAPIVYENLVGVVLNKVDMNLFRRYANEHEGYYYNKYYERYGYTE